MAGMDFRLPGMENPLENPESFVTGVLRNFREAATALGKAQEFLVLRLARPSSGSDPDYQIQTLDGEDAAVFSGSTHDFKHDDITVHLEESEMIDQSFTSEQVKDWLNELNGEGMGTVVNPILSDRWLEGDTSDPRD